VARALVAIAGQALGLAPADAPVRDDGTPAVRFPADSAPPSRDSDGREFQDPRDGWLGSVDARPVAPRRASSSVNRVLGPPKPVTPPDDTAPSPSTFVRVPQMRGTDEELHGFLDFLLARSGFDFRGYSRAGVWRRLRRCCDLEQVETLAGLSDLASRDPAVLSRVVREISVSATAMFRDPAFFRALREEVLPKLGELPVIRIWHAGCATGEEVYSLAILLSDLGLLHRARIYATDLNDSLLARAKAGVFPMSPMQQYTANYLASGGTRSFSDHYIARYDSVCFDPTLSENILFSQHNLATDASFGEFSLILCRNVLIYFGRQLQQRVFKLLDESLSDEGVIGLGRSETLRLTHLESAYEQVNSREKLFRRKPKGEQKL
jgi:chemotaxis protein methyltransferase CheR